jgi:hypothetical protein
MSIGQIIAKSKAYFEDGQTGDFSTFAATVLQEAAGSLTANECVDFFKERPHCPQTFSKYPFSDCDLTLYSDSDFCLDLYVWLRQDTAIHDHNFEGAFLVLEGENLQLSYTFDTRTTPVDSIEMGLLAVTDQRHLAEASVQQIRSGRQFIHHLVRLSPRVITVCLRTLGRKEQELSLFLFPSIAVPQVRFSSKEEILFRLLATELKFAEHDADIAKAVRNTGIKERRIKNWLINRWIRGQQNFEEYLALEPGFARLKDALESHEAHLKKISQFKPV